MNAAQLDLIPDHLLTGSRKYGCSALIDYLSQRGLQLSLYDLEAERVRRGLRGPKAVR